MPQPGGGGLPLPLLGDAVDGDGAHRGRRPAQLTAPLWMLCQPVQAGAHHLHGDALMIAVDEVEDVAGNQLDGLDHAHAVVR